MHEPEFSAVNEPNLIPLQTTFSSWATPISVRRPIPFTQFANLQRSGRASETIIAELKQLIHAVSSNSTVTSGTILQCLKRTRKTPDNLQVAYLLSYLGSQLLALNYSQDAELLHRRALCIGCTRLGGSHPELSFSLDWLGLAIFTQGNFNEALLLCYATKALVEETMGHQHLNICACLMNMALVCDAKGWFLYAWHLREEATRVLISIMFP